MKWHKQVFIFVLLLSSFTLPIAAENLETLENIANPPGFTVTQTSVELDQGTTIFFDVQIQDENLVGQPITIVYTNSAVAAIDLNAKTLSALSAGQSTASIIIGNSRVNVSISVNALRSMIYFQEDPFYLIRGLSYTIAYDITNDPNLQKSIVWSSSNTAVASVENGRVQGKAIGKTIITATVDGNTASMVLYVTAPLQAINFSVDQLTMNPATVSEPLKLYYTPYDTTDDKTVVYTMDDPSIATLDNQMQVHALREGTTYLNATVDSFVARIPIYVVYPKDSAGNTYVPLTTTRVDGSNIEMELTNFPQQILNRLHLTIPSADLNAVITTQTTSSLVVVLPDKFVDENYAAIANLTLSQDSLTLLKDKTLTIRIVNQDYQLLGAFQFNHVFSKDVDLLYTLRLINTDSALGQQIATKAYQLDFNQNSGFPIGTQIGLPWASFGVPSDTTLFLYTLHTPDQKILDTKQTSTRDNQNLYWFAVSDATYVLTPNRISRKDNGLMVTFIAVAAVGLSGLALWLYQKDKKKAVSL